MRLHSINIKFFPKYQLLIGFNVLMHETVDMKKDIKYDGVDIEFGIGLILLTITVLKKRGD